MHDPDFYDKQAKRYRRIAILYAIAAVASFAFAIFSFTNL